MDLAQLRDFCLAFQATTEELPFDENTLVFKVAGKMFALTDLENFESLNLKCDPEIALQLREQYNSVSEGYHMNKKHWNTIKINDDMDDATLFRWVKHSYELVVKGLSKKQREAAGIRL